jgi:hypothetical protein
VLPSRTRTISTRHPVSPSVAGEASRPMTSRCPSGDQRARSTSRGNVDRTMLQTLCERRSMTRISLDDGPAEDSGAP